MNRALEFRVGLLTILALTLFVWLLSKVEDVRPFSHVYGIGVTFSDVLRLSVGDPVRLNGLPVGKVKGLALKEDRVLVWLEVDRKYQVLRKARISIGTAGFFGANYIKIQQPLGTDKARVESLAADEIVTGIEEAGIDTLMDEGHNIFTSARRTFEALNNIVGEADFRSNVKDTVRNLKLASGKANDLLERLDSKVDEVGTNLQKLTDDLSGTVEENRANVKRSMDDLQQLLGDLRATVSENREDVHKIVHNVENFTGQFGEKGETVKKVNDALDRLAKLLKDYGSTGSIGTELATAAKNMSAATSDLKTVAGKAKDFVTDPKTEDKVEQVVRDVHELSKQSQDLGSQMDKFKFDLKTSTFWDLDNQELRGDITAVASYDDKYYAYLGQDRTGPAEGVNTVQLGTRMFGKYIVRSGAFRDTSGMAVDAEVFDKKGLVSVEGYRFDDPIYRVIGRYHYNKSYDLMLRRENINQANASTMVGVEHHF
jgi:phospholipid/cholesterol/gamma-HCH transport system substrate-binding protein